MAANFHTLKDIYPETNESIFFKLKKIDEIKNDALILLDTNILLLPYKTDSKNLSEITKIFTLLKESDQLYIPAHSIREFLKNRPNKIAEIYEALNKKSSSNIQYVENYPVLSNLDEYSELLSLANELRESVEKYHKKIRDTMKTIKDWAWDDPVSSIYRDLFSERILCDEHINFNDLEKDLEKRNMLSQPPGFKDKGKDFNASGDLIIWKEILNCARNKDKDVIFISADEKNDWWHLSGKQSLYPRFELIDEFRRETSGKSFHIIPLSKLLSLFGSDEAMVQSVKKIEAVPVSFEQDAVTLYKDYPEYRRHLGIPETHRITCHHESWKQKQRLDIDTYTIDEYGPNGDFLWSYKLYDSTHMDPPFSRNIYGKKIKY